MSQNPDADKAERFLANLRVCDAESVNRGITWHELYVLYRIRGYPKPIKDDNDNKTDVPKKYEKEITNWFYEEKNLNEDYRKYVAPYVPAQPLEDKFRIGDERRWAQISNKGNVIIGGSKINKKNFVIPDESQLKNVKMVIKNGRNAFFSAKKNTLTGLKMT